MIETSQTIADLATALAKAQGEIENAVKDGKNPHFKGSSYATLASIWNAIRAPLSKHGIAVMQCPSTDENGSVLMTTRLVHSSGDWMQSHMACKPAAGTAQALGSVITYLRRYALAAMVGIAPEDDDGNSGSGTGNNTGHYDSDVHMLPPAPPQVKITPENWQNDHEGINRRPLSSQSDSRIAGIGLDPKQFQWAFTALTELDHARDDCDIDEWHGKHRAALSRLSNLPRLEEVIKTAINDAMVRVENNTAENVKELKED